MSAYRAPGEPGEDIVIPPARRVQARQALARAIVAPVRFVCWAWPWFAMNAVLNVAMIGPYVMGEARACALVALALNVAAGIGYGLYRAYRWAKRELEE